MTIPALPRPYLSLLSQLVSEGGSADLARNGVLTVGANRDRLPGDAMAWLTLVSHGLIGGEGGKLIATEYGRQVAHTLAQGLIREAV